MNDPKSAAAGSGSGLCYSLALFISHEANVKYVLAEVELMAAEGALRFEGDVKENQSAILKTVERLAATRWFSRALGPMLSLHHGTHLSHSILKRINHLQTQCVRWALPESPATAPTILNVSWAVEEAKEIIRLIDEHHGIPTTRESKDMRGRKEPALVFRL